MNDIKVITFGCRLNIFESEIIRQRIQKAGIKNTIVIHTCAITSEAERQAKQQINKVIKENPKSLENAINDLTIITGQKPVATKAKKAIAGFKLRQGQAIGCKVTLRGENMYNFLDKLISITLPRVRDFRGISNKAFDGRGNYTLGLTEQLIFPEIEYDDVVKVRGMDIVFVTSAKTDAEAFDLLQGFGMPFKK